MSVRMTRTAASTNSHSSTTMAMRTIARTSSGIGVLVPASGGAERERRLADRDPVTVPQVGLLDLRAVDERAVRGAEVDDRHVVVVAAQLGMAAARPGVGYAQVAVLRAADRGGALAERVRRCTRCSW